MNESDLNSKLESSLDGCLSDVDLDKFLKLIDQSPSFAEKVYSLLGLPSRSNEMSAPTNPSEELECLLGMTQAMSYEPLLTVPMFPKSIGEFRLVHRIKSRGGSTAVFEAERMDKGSVVVVKLLRLDGAISPTRARFQREFELLNELNHRNLVKVYEHGVNGDWRFIVMERLVGLDLAEILRQLNSLPLSIACGISAEVVTALKVLSDKCIVHRDIKPSNIFLTTDGEVKLIDFGIAKQSQNEDVTQTDEVVGTFDYMAPEQALGSNVDSRCDIYGLGCTLYHMLAGTPPFSQGSSGSPLRKALAHAVSPFPDVRNSRPDVTEELVTIIRQMCAKSPDDRIVDLDAIRSSMLKYGSVQEVVTFAQSLQNTLSSEGSSKRDAAMETTPLATPPASWNIRKWQSIALVILAFVGIALGVCWGWKQDAGPIDVAVKKGELDQSIPDVLVPITLFDFKRHVVSELFIHPRQAIPADIDKDGDLDLAFGSDEKIGWFENDGSQSFLFRKINQPYIVTAIKPMDFDLDGDIDLVATAWGNENPAKSESSLVVYRQNQDSSFDWLIVTDQLRGAINLDVSDLNEDRLEDLVAASSKDGTFRAYKNLGSNQFEELVIAQGLSPRSVSIADFDGDGAKDAILTSEQDHKVRVVYGPIFSNSAIVEVIANVQSARGLSVADLENDGDIDLVVGSGSGEGLKIIENVGSRQWKVRELCQHNHGASHLKVVDFDLDGDLDILAASLNRRSIVLYVRDGEQFRQTLVSGNAIGVYSCYAADLDGDGDMDVCSASIGDSCVAWFENLGVRGN